MNIHATGSTNMRTLSYFKMIKFFSVIYFIEEFEEFSAREIVGDSLMYFLFFFFNLFKE